MEGGNGNDIYYVDNPGDIVNELAGGGLDTIRTEISYTLGENVEQLRLLGTASINGSGNEYDNLLVGNSGNNSLNGRVGADTMKGGTGNDTYYVDNAGDVVVEDTSAGTDTVRTTINLTLGANVERGVVTGSAGLTLTGNTLANELVGGSGADTLRGLSGNDTLTGGAGNDTLDGGTGRDRFEGGSGADSFIFRDGDFSGLTNATADVILDFNSADGDKIKLDLVDANALVGGNQAFSFIGTAAFTNSAGQLRFQQAGGDTYIYGDTNGDGSADFMIRLSGLHSLDSGDFLF